MSNDIVYQQLSLKKGTEYFLYVGEIKAYSLNEFFREALQKFHDKRIDFIAIVPDVLERYPEGNLLAINPEATRLSRERGTPVSCRLPGRTFAALVSHHPAVIELVETLTASQERVWITMFHALSEMTLDRLPGVEILAPNSRVADRWNNKLYMYKTLQGKIPLPEFILCGSRRELMEKTRKLWDAWRDGLFLSLEYSAAGIYSFIARDQQELKEKLGDWQPPYLVSRFVPHTHDPTVLGVVANDREVYIAGIADQRMEQLNKFRGSTAPSVLPPETQSTLKELTREVGRQMGASGYRGIFGCDYIVTGSGEVLFVEVNARKQGTTMEMCCHLELSLNAGAPSLMELEYWALTRNAFPPGLKEMEGNPSGIHWGTYNFKVEEDVFVHTGLGWPAHEREIFKKVATNGRGAEHIVVEHIGRGFFLKAGAFLGRVIAVADSPAGVAEGLKQGERALAGTIRKEGQNGEGDGNRN